MCNHYEAGITRIPDIDDVAQEIHWYASYGHSAEEIAFIIDLDVKTVHSIMYHNEISEEEK